MVYSLKFGASVLPQKQLLDPAIKGTLNVLTAAKEAGVSRVVVTSSISAITPSPNWPADIKKAEDCWTDIEYCKQKGVSAPAPEFGQFFIRLSRTITGVPRLDHEGIA